MTVGMVLLTDLRTSKVVCRLRKSLNWCYIWMLWRPMSAVYKRNSKGPSTEPCGTPQRTRVEEDVFPAKWTDWNGSVKYDANHRNAWSLMPNDFASRSRRIVWSTVSKAADWSSIASRVCFPLLASDIRSDTTLARRVSVEWNFLYADWWLGRSLKASRWNSICVKTTRSRTLDRNGRFDIGL